jgi:cytochrome c2
MKLRPPHQLTIIIVVCNFAMAVILFIVDRDDQLPPWKNHQEEYQQELSKRSSAFPQENSSSSELAIRELPRANSGKIDRCTTCHLAVENPQFTNHEHPLKYHPQHDQHSFQEFGCTICHGGDGMATTAEAAHGRTLHSSTPMVPMEHIEASCLQCHQAQHLEQAPNLVAGQKHFEQMGCRACHSLKERGGDLGPKLDDIGLKRDIPWLLEFLKNPSDKVPGISMPPVVLSDFEILQLAIYLKGQVQKDTTNLHNEHQTVTSIASGGEIFIARGCVGCHKPSSSDALNESPWLPPKDWSPKDFALYLLQPHHMIKGEAPFELRLAKDERMALGKYLHHLANKNP